MPPLCPPPLRPTITIPWTSPTRYDILIRETFASVRRRFSRPHILSLVLRVQTLVKRILVSLGWAPRPRRKALLIGIKSVDQKSPIDPKVRPGHRKYTSVSRMKQNRDLKGPHRDVLDMAKVLQDVYAYHPDDITCLIDDDHPEQFQPTLNNILSCIDDLVKDAQPGDRFFFHFSGHCAQQDTDDVEEEDRKNELLMTCDGELLPDNDLRKRLVDPLPKDSSLVAVFDSCHSTTLLDLPHYRCNRVWVPWQNKGQRKSDYKRNNVFRHLAVIPSPRRSAFFTPTSALSLDQVLASPLRLDGEGFHHAASVPMKRPTIETRTHRLAKSESYAAQYVMSPVEMYCTGHCRETNQDPFTCISMPRAEVIALSSSKDGEKSWENPEGSSMTQVLIRILKNNPHPTFKLLLTQISHELHHLYLQLHDASRIYRDNVRSVNSLRLKKGKAPRRAQTVEMDNFQNPQLSSVSPLNMERLWEL